MRSEITNYTAKYDFQAPLTESVQVTESVQETESVSNNGKDMRSGITNGYYTDEYDSQAPLPKTKALKITDSVRDIVSLTVSFTDYELQTIVRPKMSQPGKFFCFDE